MEGYRERCYQSYVTTHWKYIHALSSEEYNLLVKGYHKRFKNILPKDRTVKIIDIACGTGRGLWKHDFIVEPRIFAIGKKI